MTVLDAAVIRLQGHKDCCHRGWFYFELQRQLFHACAVNKTEAKMSAVSKTEAKMSMFLTYPSQAAISGRIPPLALVLGTVAALGLLFQVGHFAEHAMQFTVWVLGDLSNICGRDMPWMSSWATEMVRQLGLLLFPSSNAARRMMLGMEILHLIGNSIFLVSLACLYYCVRSTWVRWALFIETFHLYEHIMLTATAYFIGKPIGLSTLFGGSDIVGSREFAVGYRITWHFAMNLLPMPFAMIGMMEAWRHSRAHRLLDCASVAMSKTSSG